MVDRICDLGKYVSRFYSKASYLNPEEKSMRFP